MKILRPNPVLLDVVNAMNGMHSLCTDYAGVRQWEVEGNGTALMADILA